MVSQTTAALPERPARRSLCDDSDRGSSAFCIVGGEDLAGAELFPHDIEEKFRDTYDRLRYVSESLDVVRDEIGGLRDYLQARIANEQNEIMKALTIVAALVLIPTFVVGFYGQNFDWLPGQHGHLGFWTVCLLMLIIVSSEMWYLWHRGWIGRGTRRRDVKPSGRKAA